LEALAATSWSLRGGSPSGLSSLHDAAASLRDAADAPSRHRRRARARHVEHFLLAFARVVGRV